MSERSSPGQIDAEAARWLFRLDREQKGPDVEAELSEWLKTDSRCAGALLRAEAAWYLLDLQAQKATDIPHEDGALPVEESEDESSRPFRRRWVGWTGAAALAAGLAAVVFFPPAGEQYETKIGEIRQVPLADSSTASINTASRIEIDFNDKRRRVALERGEVLFQVAKNPDRPFIVEAGPVRVEAVGTAFSVRRYEARTDVLVTQGVVRVWHEGSSDKPVRLVAGSKISIADTEAVQTAVAAPLDVERQLAWRTGRLDLAGETLGEAVSEINRYNERKIVIADQALAKQRLYGVFRTDDPEGFSRAAATILEASTRTEADGDIVLRSAQ